MSVFFLGTCRMHDPAEVLREAGRKVQSTPHRIHSLKQSLQFVKHVGGHDRFYSERNFHHLSALSIRKVVDGKGPLFFKKFERLSRRWPKHKVVFIEISSLREYSIKRTTKHRFYTNTFSWRDMQTYGDEIASLIEDGLIDSSEKPVQEKLSEREAIRTMAEIKKFLPGRKIVWVSHMRPPKGDPALANVIDVRERLAAILERGADYLGDEFFDPSAVAIELGPEKFFQKDGEDLDHLTPEAASVLASRYFALAKQLEPSLR